jgi:uncharacterized protein (TIGR03435 family)
VENRTGLTGRVNFALRFTPDRDLPPAPADAAPAQPPGAPYLLTALQEQLGLKLESTTGPVEVLVIDRVERPTPD